jgi:hypothetical protein
MPTGIHDIDDEVSTHMAQVRDVRCLLRGISSHPGLGAHHALPGPVVDAALPLQAAVPEPDD